MTIRKNVPWNYTTSQALRTWQWITPHFDAQIRSDESGFLYSITDLTQGVRMVIATDMTVFFHNAEDAVVELISKSYPMELGYREYAGNLATTFLINDYTRLDFSPYEGTSVMLVYASVDGKETVTGSLQVVNHSIEITLADQSTMVFPPALIISVHTEFSNSDADGKTIEVNRNMSKLTNSRVVQGEFIRGCTGNPGFHDKMIEHGANSAWCPVHRI